MLKHSIVNLKNRILANPFYISGLFLFFSIIFLFIFFNRTSRNTLVEQVQHRQLVTVRAGTNSIEGFLNAVGKAGVTLANDTSYSEIDEFTNLWASSNVSGLIVTNKEGTLIRNSNPLKIRDTGGDLSERDYFKWAMNAKRGEYKVFPPVISKAGTSKGKYVVTISTPITKNGEFDGVLTIAILLSELTNNHLSELKVLDSSKVYLVTSSGEIIYSDYPEFLGKNFKDILPKDFLGKEKVVELISDELKKDDESKLKLAIPNFENNFGLETYLISSAPIQVSDELWKVVVVTPEKELLIFTYNSLNKQIFAVFIVAVIFILLTLRSSKNTGYNEAVVDEHKEHNIS